MPFLAAEPLDFRDRQAMNAHISEGFSDFIELEWFDNRDYLLHFQNLQRIYQRCMPLWRFP